MVIALSVALVINVVFLGLIALRLARLEVEIDATRVDVTAVRGYFIAPAVGGRVVPSPSELTAARNRVDAQGTAHPGGS
jgi:predicted alternative tryptophan synthase beta-subunit